jgi:glycosyltransferase involved in cell wall biosynthesis
MDKPKSIVIIPAYNEEASIERTVEDLISVAKDVDFIVVNDGSGDATAEICRQNSYPFIDLPINLGLAGAFQAGMKYALKHGYDCAIQFDGDGQHVPKYVEGLAMLTNEADIVIGSRFVEEAKPRSMRMLGSNLISTTIKLTTGTTIKDPTSGMRAYNKRMIEIMANNLNVGPEPDTISYLIKKKGAKIKEMQVTMRERQAGESYLTAGVSVKYMLKMMISILFVQFFRKS